MEDKIVYLKHGEEAKLIQEIGNQYLVSVLMYNEEGDEWYSDQLILVDEVFNTAPMAKLEKQYAEMKQRMADLNKEMTPLHIERNQLKQEIIQLKSQKTDLSKYIINRSDIINATNCYVFVSGNPMPIHLEKLKEGRMSFIINFLSNTINQIQVYKGNSSSGDFIEEKYGILCDPTEEELKGITYTRILDKRSYWMEHPQYLQHTPDEYLTPELIKVKNAYISKVNELAVVNIGKSIKQKELELNELKNQLGKLIIVEPI
jgi:hypothetical protein